MFEYYKYIIDDEGVELNNYVELDADGFCLRMILEKGEQYYTSNFVHSENPCFLPEGSLEEFKTEMNPVQQEVFYKKWDSIMLLNKPRFESLKVNNPIGKVMPTVINCFYPQGVILNLESNFHGITNHSKCLQLIGTDKMYPGTILNSKISGYDNENMMLIFETLDSP
ncbi:MAG: hypothetical protein ACJA0U_002238 [Salibacteraceae bacterium]|jgi:hypothetical protein